MLTKLLSILAVALMIIGVGVVLQSTFCSKETICSEATIKIIPRVFGEIQGKRITPTHIYFDDINNVEIVSDFSNHRFLYRDLSESGDDSKWKKVNLASVKKPHAITYHPSSNIFFAADTGNNQIISFKSLDDDDSKMTKYTQFESYSVGKRPHDIAYNAKDNFIYALVNRGVIRFLPVGNQITEVTFHSRTDLNNAINKKLTDANFSVGYMRSISIVDGVLFLINSTQGNVIQINDFLDSDTWTAHINDNQPSKYAEAGTYDKDGLILNDVEYYQGYWYATNYYPGKTNKYISDASVSKNKLIRWRTWDDFKQSNWQDLSHLVHPESITYYFSKHRGKLYLSMFHGGNVEGKGSGVYEIKTSYF